MKKILSFNQIQKSLLLLQNLNLHLPINLNHKQILHLKTVDKHSQIKEVDHNRDPGPGRPIQKEKEKQKDKEKGPIPLRTWS